ncbi:hypothetical protein [Streptomyces sp. NPDC059080]|uniref:hypothetical protein n=1 Tax=Streptomyces sp. NPDC059080 TaxID=3346718 RepID=UPI00368F3186
MTAPLLQRYRESLLATDLAARRPTGERPGPSAHPLWRRYVASLLDIPLPHPARATLPDGRSDAPVTDSRRPVEARIQETELAPVVVRPPLPVPSAAAWRPRRTRVRALVAAAALCAAAVAGVMTLPYTSSMPTPPADTVAPSSSAVPETPDGYRRVHDPAGFTVDVPLGWSRSQKSDGVFYLAEGGKNLIQIFRATALLTTPYESVKTADQNLSGNPGYKRIRMQKISSGDDAAAELEYSYNSEKYGPRHVVDRVFVGDDGKQYAILIAGPADQRLEQRRRQEVVLGSFSLTG